MTITPEMLAAYADGELGAEEAALVEAAMAEDPALAEEVAAHRDLRRQLVGHFAGIAEQPVPDRLLAALRPAGQAPAPVTNNVVSLAAIRAERKAAEPRAPASRRWVMGGALAASLALGLVLGTQLPSGGDIGTEGGKLVARGALDKALTHQLASAQAEAPVRILVSFKAQDGRYCRGFEQGPTAGIACRIGRDWAVVQTQSGREAAPGGQYRQAGSHATAILAAAQDMAEGGALDSAAEKAARDGGWRVAPEN